MSRIELNSTALRAATYQDQPAKLELEFRNGTIYQYLSVPPQTYQALLGATSKGAYFHYHIRGRFACTKIHPEAKVQFPER